MPACTEPNHGKQESFDKSIFLCSSYLYAMAIRTGSLWELIDIHDPHIVFYAKVVELRCAKGLFLPCTLVSLFIHTSFALHACVIVIFCLASYGLLFGFHSRTSVCGVNVVLSNKAIIYRVVRDHSPTFS